MHRLTSLMILLAGCGMEHTLSPALSVEIQDAPFIEDEVVAGLQPGSQRTAAEALAEDHRLVLLRWDPSLGMARLGIRDGRSVGEVLHTLKSDKRCRYLEPNYVVMATRLVDDDVRRHRAQPAMLHRVAAAQYLGANGICIAQVLRNQRRDHQSVVVDDRVGEVRERQYDLHAFDLAQVL